MTMAAVSQCAECGAVVNMHWPSCLVCRAILPTSHEVLAPSAAWPENQGQAESPMVPILSGWLVTYRNSKGTLCGGAEDRAHGTVQECRWNAGRWTVYLTDGHQVPMSLIRAVGQTDANGRLCAAWTVRDHGYDGMGLSRDRMTPPSVEMGKALDDRALYANHIHTVRGKEL